MSGVQANPIARYPDIQGGAPIFAGTRVPVSSLFEYLESGKDLRVFLEDFPTVEREQAVRVLMLGREKLLERGELHDLVDQLGEEQAREALSLLRRLLRDTGRERDAARARVEDRMGPSIISAKEFFSRPPMSLEEIAARQGVEPVENIDDLRGDFWPEDEPADEVTETVRTWRREGGYA
jgi:uncharacterized protein (DUF433 family)